MSSQKTQQNVKQRIINEARLVLSGKKKNNAELKALCGDLERIEQFSYATDILLTIMAQNKEDGIPTSLKEHQTLAKYIYKDQSLPSSFKFDKALAKLNSDASYVTSCETFGLKGAIYKRQWQFDNQYKNLGLSNDNYKKGYSCWKTYINEIEEKKNKDLNDDGYTAINYAFTCELMALVKWKELSGQMDLIKFSYDLLIEADTVRDYILNHFIENPYSQESILKKTDCDSWVIASIAEAYFGLKQYDFAIKYIKQYLNKEEVEVEKSYKEGFTKEELFSWKIKSFTQQMISIASTQLVFKHDPNINKLGTSEPLKINIGKVNDDKIHECLIALGRQYDLADNEAAGFKATGEGKAGLALSGGGFRAAIFHIGVLASLAEKDKLKDIEVISCVSGGSIIGAYYYIKLKKLLETKADTEIDSNDYIQIVKDIEKKFLERVQENLRMRIFSNLLCNFKMFLPSYSRTHRLGELYEEHLFKEIFEAKENRTEIYMSDLFISPKGDTDFSIIKDNWKRKNKVPQLILNATSVNTGHNWQFTASWMGEPPGAINDDIDVKPRLRRMYYNDAPGKYKKFRLGHAVAASSCVPVMFEPLPMKDLYPDIDLQLIDGGLHDNQGIGSLLEQECKNVFISDGSGQLPSNTESTKNEGSLFWRADNILQERVREIQFMDLKERHLSTQITELNTFHLKKGLLSPPVNWKDCTDPARKLLYEKACPKETDHTEYGILRTVQQGLSEIRTDLDSFNNTESYALMYSAYKQSKFVLKDTSSPKADWLFLKIEDEMVTPASSHTITKLLTTGSKKFFKLYSLSILVKVIVGVIVLFLGIIIWENKNHVFEKSITLGSIALIALLFLITMWNKTLGSLLDYKTTLRKYSVKFFAAILGFIVCWFYLIIVNPWYNKIGKLKGKFN